VASLGQLIAGSPHLLRPYPTLMWMEPHHYRHAVEITAEHRDRLKNYERRSTVPLVSVALFFLVLYAIPIIWPDISPGVEQVLDGLSAITWLIFVVDLGTRAYLSGRPVSYLIRHPIDVVLIALPMLRPLRVLRVFTAANYLITRGGRFAVGRTVASAVAGAVFLMGVASLAVLDAERGATGANITSYGDALWWSGATVTTVGYGDVYPVTVTGRLVAFALMLVGISVLGIVTASVATWFVQSTQETEDEVLAELRFLRAEIAGLRADRDGSDISAHAAHTETNAAPLGPRT
jgi:voltage-gated potassium channel